LRAQIYKWMNKTATECRSGVQCEVYSAGQSFEGRPINVFKVIVVRKGLLQDALL